MPAIMHITQAGHKCPKPAMITTPASYVKAGDCLALGLWELSYSPRGGVYVVHRDVAAYGQFDYYEFHNFNCAAAKLEYLGRAK